MKKKDDYFYKGKIGFDAKKQDERSLATLLREHDVEGYIPFHMPGHKRNKLYEHLNYLQSLDITEIEGFDNLHNASGVLFDAQKRAAKIFGAKESRFLTCGSTGGVLACIRAMTHAGDAVLIARNCHRSVYNAVDICGLRPFYVAPAYFEEYGFYGSVMPEDVDKALQNNPEIKLVVVTSPTYEGVISDIKSISAVCRAHGAALFVDEAHGAHLGLNRRFEKSARSLGADAVVNSLHKTLPCLTQTALLHVCSDKVDIARLDKNLAVFQTSSPSYVLMASIDGFLRRLEGTGREELDMWTDMLEKFRRSISRCKKVRLFEAGSDGRVFAYDKTKLVFLTVDSAMSGIELAKELRNEYKLELEMASANYALAMTGAGDRFSAFLALSEAIFELDANAKERYGLVNIDGLNLPQKAFEPHQIDGLSVETVNLDESVGKVCAESVWAYPPGSPLICKGEIIEQEFVRHALFLYECGVNIQSENRGFPNSISVVAQ